MREPMSSTPHSRSTPATWMEPVSVRAEPFGQLALDLTALFEL